MNETAKEIIMLGAGGHARVLLAGLRSTGGKVKWCIAPEKPDRSWPKDVEWIGNDSRLAGLDPDTYLLANGVGSINADGHRRALFDESRAKGFQFVQLRHPAAMIAATASVGEGSQIMAGAIIQDGVRIGDNVIVNTGAIVDHDCTISGHAHLAPGACLSGSVTVGTGAHVGTGATIIQDISIGEWATVGAGSVVLGDVDPYTTVVGNPARKIVRSK